VAVLKTVRKFVTLLFMFKPDCDREFTKEIVAVEGRRKKPSSHFRNEKSRQNHVVTVQLTPKLSTNHCFILMMKLKQPLIIRESAFAPEDGLPTTLQTTKNVITQPFIYTVMATRTPARVCFRGGSN
jgi:hypothetical protein